MYHRWANRIFPPLVVVAVVGGVWYAAAHRASEAEAIATTTNESTPVVANASAKPAAAASAEALTVPTVEKLPGTVKFTVDTKKVTKVQKVEFYVSNRLVGAAYNEPYTVSIDEKSLQPGTHQVVAKVYTDSATKDTPPADFISTVAPGSKPSTDAIATTPPTNTPSVPSAPSSSSNNQNPSANSGQSTTPSPAPQPASPVSNVQATASTDSTPLITVTWDAPADGSATIYQISRNGELLEASYTGTTYTDTSVTPGQLYTYEIISVGAGGNSTPTDSNAATYTPPDPSV